MIKQSLRIIIRSLAIVTVSMHGARSDAASGSPVTDGHRVAIPIPYVPYEIDPPIICWGDSLTAGAGTTPNHDYPSLITFLYHRPTLNQGIGGETSSQIRARLFKDAIRSAPNISIIWAGRNNYDAPATVFNDIAAMVAALPHGSPYLVLSVLNGDYETERKGGSRYNVITTLNRRLSETYGARYVALREALIEAYNPRFPKDVTARAQDIPPPSLRSDRIHLNDEGEAIVASEIERALKQNGL